jgi:hypothetical protein
VLLASALASLSLSPSASALVLPWLSLLALALPSVLP